jgi:hypothetical protein
MNRTGLGHLLGPDWAMARPDFFAKSKLTRMTLKAQSTNTLPCLVCLTLLGPKLIHRPSSVDALPWGHVVTARSYDLDNRYAKID